MEGDAGRREAGQERGRKGNGEKRRNGRRKKIPNLTLCEIRFPGKMPHSLGESTRILRDP